MLCLITYCHSCSKETLCYSETIKDPLKCSDCIKNLFTEVYIPDDNHIDENGGYDCD